MGTPATKSGKGRKGCRLRAGEGESDKNVSVLGAPDLGSSSAPSLGPSLGTHSPSLSSPLNSPTATEYPGGQVDGRVCLACGVPGTSEEDHRLLLAKKGEGLADPSGGQ